MKALDCILDVSNKRKVNSVSEKNTICLTLETYKEQELMQYLCYWQLI